MFDRFLYREGFLFPPTEVRNIIFFARKKIAKDLALDYLVFRAIPRQVLSRF